MGQIIPVNQSLAEMGVEALVTRLQKDLYELDEDRDSYGEDWFSSCMDHFTTYHGMARGFEHARALNLAIIDKHWDKLDPAIKNKLGFTFKAFSTTWTGREWSTVDNWVRTANVWLGKDRAKMPQVVRIVQRKPDGSPDKDEQGKIITKDVSFNPWLVDLSKLLRLNSRVVKGNMTDRLWELLADPVATCEDIDIETVVREEKQVSLYYTVNGPLLCAREGEEEVCIAEITEWESFYYGPAEGLAKRGIETLLTRLNITLDEDKIVIEQHRKNMEQ